MKKIIVPVLLVAIGTGTAFATNVAKKSSNAIVPGYMLVEDDPGHFTCVDAKKDCWDIQVGPICELSPGVQLRKLDSPTECGQVLREIP